MRRADWEQVITDQIVPTAAERDELTTELVRLFDDPAARDDLALPVLSHWLHAGVYDTVLTGLGEGLRAAITPRRGPDARTGVTRRAAAALALSWILHRDRTLGELSRATTLSWADEGMAWLLREEPTGQPVVADMGTIGVAAELLGALSASRFLGAEELSVLLDVVADRLLAPTDVLIPTHDLDRLAFAICSILHRELITLETAEHFAGRLRSGIGQRPATGTGLPAAADNTTRLTRALHLQLILGVVGTPAQDSSTAPSTHPSIRTDLLLTLQDVLRSSAPQIFGLR